MHRLFHKATISVLPHVRLRQLVQLDGNQLIVNGRKYKFPPQGCHVVGFGKAVIGMAAELQRILDPDNIRKAVLSVPSGICASLVAAGHTDQLPQLHDDFSLHEGAKDNIPDAEALHAAQLIADVADSLCSEDDLLLVLVSGGGSALLPSPIAPLSLEDKAKITKDLSKAGATIQELNAVRIQLSSLKGGKLARRARPGRVVAFILSDIIDDPIELISSGPTVPMPKQPSAFDILQKYNVEASAKVTEALNNAPVIPDGNNVDNFLIGSNKIALQAALSEALREDYNAYILTSRLSGEAKSVGALFGLLAFHASHAHPSPIALNAVLKQLLFEQESTRDAIIGKIFDLKKPLCLLAGGETTVKVIGGGRGGRNQEMVLAAMLEYHNLTSSSSTPLAALVRKADAIFLSAGTDGIDGPTDAAGAISDQNMCLDARAQGLDPLAYLQNNDSYMFFNLLSNGKHLIKTGHTGTNVMDIQILMINPI